MKDETPPKEMYLQFYRDDERARDLGLITWCEEQINESDVKYVLESELTALREENARLRDAALPNGNVLHNGKRKHRILPNGSELNDGI